MSSGFGVLVGAIFGFFVLSTLFGGILMLVAAKFAGIVEATFGRSLLAALGGSFVVWIATLVCSVVPVAGTLIGFAVGVLLSLIVIKGVFSTSFGKAFLVWIFNGVAHVLAIVIGVFTFAAGSVALFKSVIE